MGRLSVVQVSPLSTPSMWITVSGGPPFLPNILLENGLCRFSKFASVFKTVSVEAEACAVSEAAGLVSWFLCHGFDFLDKKKLFSLIKHITTRKT